MRTITFAFLLSLVVQLTTSSQTVPPPCSLQNYTIYVDQMNFGSYSTSRYHGGLYSMYSAVFCLPTAPLNAVRDRLNAREETPTSYSVKCDDASVKSYPDLIFVVNGVKVAAEPSDYIQLYSPSSDNYCALYIGYCPDIVAQSIDYLFPSYLERQLCWAENGTTVNCQKPFT
ncbi:hypothetical protein M3Y95_00324900 [Aphelenchoides besseyi]|nr:hypothetical protein M3Y95_00324900 [Aphelenchoides besseyi]